MQKRPTQKLIAQISGYGITTVSLALKDGPQLRRSTRERIQLIAKGLGYVPDRAGRSLQSGRTGAVALILEGDSIEGEAELVRGAAKALQDRGHSLLVRFAAEGAGTLGPVLETKGIADGLLFLGDRASDERVRYLLEEDIPFATYGRTSADPKHAFHDFDYSGFASLAVATLKKRGARRVLLLHSMAHWTRSRLLEEGLREACARHGVPELVLRRVERDFTRPVPLPEDRLLGNLLVSGDGVILCDQHAIEPTVAAANALGLRVGHEVFLFARQIGSQSTGPRYGSIDTVVEDLELAGRELASSVLQLIGGKPPEGLHRLQTVGPVHPPDDTVATGQ